MPLVELAICLSDEFLKQMRLGAVFLEAVKLDARAEENTNKQIARHIQGSMTVQVGSVPSLNLWNLSIPAPEPTEITSSSISSALLGG